MSQSSAESTPLFTSSVATLYDEILGPAFFEPYAIETTNRVAALNPQKVLETACGTGRVTNHLRKVLSKSATLIATDISNDMLAVAEKKLSAIKDISWQQADAMNLPFDDESFDAVVCQFGAMFFADRKKGFIEAMRVLKNGGAFIFSVWDKLEFNPVTAASRQILKDFFEGNPPKSMNMAFSMTDKNDIANQLTETGFTNIKIETVNKVCIAESAEGLAKAIIDGSTNSDYIKERDANAAPFLKKKIAKAISEKFGDHPVKGTMQAIIIAAEKL